MQELLLEQPILHFTSISLSHFEFLIVSIGLGWVDCDQGTTLFGLDFHGELLVQGAVSPSTAAIGRLRCETERVL